MRGRLCRGPVLPILCGVWVESAVVQHVNWGRRLPLALSSLFLSCLIKAKRAQSLPPSAPSRRPCSPRPHGVRETSCSTEPWGPLLPRADAGTPGQPRHTSFCHHPLTSGNSGNMKGSSTNHLRLQPSSAVQVRPCLQGGKRALWDVASSANCQG